MIWNLILVGYFGLVTGNLISLAVLTGWSATGFAWRLAPGLAAVVFVSLVLPVATKRNLYCSHVCPHGAAQQLLRNVTNRRWKISAMWSSRLRWVPGITVFLAFAVTVAGSRWNVAAWEPFNAYAIRYTRFEWIPYDACVDPEPVPRGANFPDGLRELNVNRGSGCDNGK